MHFIYRHSWIFNLLVAGFSAGMLWLGVQNSEAQSTMNAQDVIALKIAVAQVSQKVNDIADFLGVKK